MFVVETRDAKDCKPIGAFMPHGTTHVVVEVQIGTNKKVLGRILRRLEGFTQELGVDSNEIHPANRAPSDPHSAGRTSWVMSRVASVVGPFGVATVGSRTICQYALL